MPTSPQAVQRALSRLRQIPGFPKDDPAPVTEILVDRCLTNEHLGAAVDSLLENFDFWPAPRKVFEVIDSHKPAGQAKRYGCSLCDGTGFVETTLTVGDRTAPASGACSCRPPVPPDADEWQPRIGADGVAGPVAAQAAINRAWADSLAEDVQKLADSRGIRR